MTNLLPRLQVTLENCADEPIHIPGAVQPHGALLAFDLALTLVAWSQNATSMLNIHPVAGKSIEELALASEWTAFVRAVEDDIVNGDAPPAYLEMAIDGHAMDCIAHAHQGVILVEFERREVPSDLVNLFALKAHSAISRLRRHKSIDELLDHAVRQVREITGFDRVMAYRFRHDDSGDVVAEACGEGMHPYLGQRYPASDIPAQARRLYMVNTLRLIANVDYRAIALEGCGGAAPIDMSHCVLRSVSPIHIEYLRNMGVRASMSISIVLNNRLWGLIACHHSTPHVVPYSVRMAVEVLAQVLASTLGQLETMENAKRIEDATLLRADVAETMLHAVDMLDALGAHAGQLCKVLDAHALLLSYEGQIRIFGDIAAESAQRIVDGCHEVASEIVQRTTLAEWPETLQPHLGKWVGMLALSFDPPARGWIVALRQEQSETVVWAGQDIKKLASSSLGERLTPRGSFDEWCETVRGQSIPWNQTEHAIAAQMVSAMRRSTAVRYAEIERARTELLAMLGHDLRTPLQSISMVGEIMERQEHNQILGKRIQTSSNRMARLIGQVLDMSRMNTGMEFALEKTTCDLAVLIMDAIDEACHAHPEVRFDKRLTAPLVGNIDADRMAQVIGNLISNARHHGDLGSAIRIELRRQGEQAVIAIANTARPIDAAVVASLFDPFKHTSGHNSRNRRGLGLGLYIVKRIVEAHGGTIAYSQEGSEVVFTVHLPLGI
ncbi:MAG: ATP-binding protein [Janthinobacterium lividum]